MVHPNINLSIVCVYNLFMYCNCLLYAQPRSLGLSHQAAAPDLGGTRAQAPHKVHVLYRMCDMCVPHRHFYRDKFFVDAIGSILLEYYLIL